VAGHRIRRQARVAVDSIAGYRFQILHTIRTWLTINDDRFLVAEGNEDIDHVFLNGGLQIEEQIKLRSGGLGQSDPAVIETVLNYLRAFVYHDSQGNRFVGILRTNATIAKRPTTEIGKWIAGKKFLVRTFLEELQAHADDSEDDYDYTSDLAYVRRRGKLTAFANSVEWAPTSGSPEDIENEIRELLRRRANSVPAEITYRALLAHVLDTLSHSPVEHRVLRRVDADVVLSDAALDHAVNSAEADAGTIWTAALSTIAGPPSGAVAVLVRDLAALNRLIDAQVQRLTASRRAVVLDDVVRDAIRDLDFVAYASRRMHSGSRGERVCAYDVVKQTKHRLTPSRTVISLDAPSWLDNWVTKRWPQPRRVDLHSDEGAMLRIARLISSAVLNPDAAVDFLRSMESKLRWVHDVGAGTYFTAENPLR
jgi:hypothetical protein